VRMAGRGKVSNATRVDEGTGCCMGAIGNRPVENSTAATRAAVWPC
jgi:hypothetical protein